DSVRASVRASVRDSVRDSVWASVWAYIGSFFRLPRKSWEYTEKIKTDGYPFEPAVKLWKMGLVASFDGNIYRLHGGRKAEVLFQITKAELMEKNKDKIREQRRRYSKKYPEKIKEMMALAMALALM
ncbi:MAG: hypothetical protein JXB42_00155, partial [Deltaproteobacteria bacterium]|nr:hypothetical protein [Deltaproteobacteria bacterium]